MIKQLTGTLILAVMYLIGAQIAGLFDIGIPGAVFGLVLCVIAMFAVPGLQDPLRAGGPPFLVLIPLFLVPVVVKMAVSLDFANVMTWLVVAVAAATTILGLLITGLIVKLVFGGAR
ncbi:CidA/LrgA family protein [Terrihabitans sp. B22-R8]|uniref:CidA/LrgA family protein n=1 Tax=Terrihabitans sp. B22-R8 TaxID=3425128 RepID=UPI00403CBBBA